MSIITAIFQALGILIPLLIGLYVLTQSTDKLAVSYQNYRLHRTRKPLKDESFGNLRSKILMMKVLSLFLVALGVYQALVFWMEH